MIFTTKMKQVIAVVLDRDVEKVTKELLDQSLLHFVDIKEMPGEWESKVSTVSPQISLALIKETRKRIESFLSTIEYHPLDEKELDIANLKPVDLEESGKALDKIADKLHGIRERQRLLQQEILKFEDIKRQLDLFGDIKAGIHAKSRFSFLNIQTGAIKSSGINNFELALKEVPSVNLNFQKEEDLTHILLITMKKDDGKVNTVLDRFGWIDVSLSENLDTLKEDVQGDLSTKLTALTDEQEELKKQSSDIIRKNREFLARMWENTRMNELYYKIQSYFSRTARTVIFSGWLPARSQGYLGKAIKKVTEGRCYLEWNNPAEMTGEEKKGMKIPVKFQNPKFLAPFQMLVKNFSLPEYGTVDPTPFVAIAYLLMFGLMFGDAGQGFVLIIVGILGSFLYKGKSDAMKDLMRLIIWCGASAMVAGVLFGSYFGFQWFKPLWFDYHGIVAQHVPAGDPVKTIYGILGITIYFGIGVIGVGLILNWINLVARKKWFKLIFDKGGFLGVWMYGAGVYTAFYFVGTSYKLLPPGSLLFWLFGIPAILFAVKPPLEFIIHKKHDPTLKFTPLTPVDFLMEWIVEMLEVFSGYLANTLSFMRVAGLGIAHASLMIAFYSIATMVNGGSTEGFGFWSYFILVLGNVLVIALEGLSAGIQSLRLNYYEFFSKYFSGSGEAYAPVSLRSRK